MDRLEEAFRRVNGALLEAGLPPGSPGREGRIEFSLTRLAEGRKASGYLASRYPEVVRPGARVLDLGCGNGGMLLPFIERGCRGWGLDLGLHPELPQAAAAASLPVLHLQGRGEALPFPDASFDLVILAETLEHVPDPRAMGEEVARVLRADGLAYVTTPPRLRFLFAPDPHYGVRGLLLLPDPLQRLVFERLIARRRAGGRGRGERYDVAHIFWSVAGILRVLPGLVLVEVTSRNWSGAARRLDWDWIVAKPRAAPFRDRLRADTAWGEAVLRGRNALRRLLAGLPPLGGPVSPEAPGDVYRSVEALYGFAGTQVAAGSAVLDLGCGTGFGARRLIAAGASRVVGVDPSRSAVRYARRRFGGPRVDFRRVASLAVPGDLPSVSTLGALGALVAIHSLSRVAEPEAFLDAAVARLGADGLLVASFPPSLDGRPPPRRGAGASPGAPLSLRGWHALLAQRFAGLRLFAQRPPPGGRLDLASPRASSLRAEDFRFEEVALADLEEDGILCVVIVARAPRR